MAHELTTLNGKTSMAYVGQAPWHGLGQQLTLGADRAVWLKEAGMDYRVCRSRVRFGADTDPKVWDERHVLFRSDTKTPLSIVSDRYKIVQPEEVLGFFDDLCRDHGFALETAGTLYDGARYWALARIPMDFTLQGGDKVKGYVLMATSCDGSLATLATTTAIRVVCNNTLRVATSQAKDAIKVRHSTTFDAKSVKVDMGLLSAQWADFERGAKSLAARKLSRKEALSVLIDVMGDPELPVEKQPNARPMAEILRLYQRNAIGHDLESSDGTAWGLLNAGTEYFDHHAGHGANTRIASAWFGPAATRKSDLLQALLARSDAAPQASSDFAALLTH